jgi:uncharacterized membrane protein YjjB (DUF3815 family)
MTQFIQLAAAFSGSAGFALAYHFREKRQILASGIGGCFGWLIFLLVCHTGGNDFLAGFVATVAVSFYSEAAARLLKTPASTFCIIWLLPLVPGGALYYTMTYGLAGEWTLFAEKAIYTVELAAALSLGIVLMTAASRYLPYFHRK